jgi:flagellar hook assembly protein FlgD
MQMQNDTNRVNYLNGRKNLGNSRLDREGFMRLMLALLQYQDPTEPQDNTQMLTQQLQLEQTEQIKDMTNSNRFASAAAMVGQQADLVDARWNFETATSDAPEWDLQANGPKTVTGIIESVQFDRQHNKALVKINGNYYDADQIRQLSPAPVPTTTTPSSGGA